MTAKERKKAILRNETLARRLRGTLTLTNLTTNAPVAAEPITIARVPKPTADGTMVLNGVEWTLGSQLRLRPGVFVRKTHASDVEAYVYVAPGTGATNHHTINPKTNVFNIQVGQTNIPLALLFRGRPVKRRPLNTRPLKQPECRSRGSRVSKTTKGLPSAMGSKRSMLR